MFLPEVLENGVIEYFCLEKEIVTGNPDYRPGTAETPRNNILFSIIMGIVLGGASSVLIILGRRKANYVYSGVVEIVFGILGSVLLFMMLFTNHDVTWMNENIIFINPLQIAMAVFSLLAAGRSKKAQEWGSHRQ